MHATSSQATISRFQSYSWTLSLSLSMLTQQIYRTISSSPHSNGFQGAKTSITSKFRSFPVHLLYRDVYVLVI